MASLDPYSRNCYHRRVKLTVTLRKSAEQALQTLSQEHEANNSVIAETAIMQFFSLPSPERDRHIRSMQANKKAYTRGRWRAAFWDAIFDQFWFPARLRTGRRNDFTPLTFAGFQVWFLLNSLADLDPEDGPFFVHIMASPSETRLKPNEAQQQFTFQRDDSPYDAAKKIGSTIFELATSIGALEIVQIPDGGRALLDYSGSHWMAENERDQDRLSLPIPIRRGDKTCLLDRNWILRQSNETPKT